jgi:hypothetical protein
MTLLKGERQQSQGGFDYCSATIRPAHLKRDNFLTEEALISQAEPISVMAWLEGAEYPKPYLDLAWRYLLSNHTHDANAGCASDDVTLDVQYRYRQSRELSESLVQEGLKELLCRIDTRQAKPDDIHLALFNPLPMERDEVIPITLALPERLGAKSVVIADSQGNPMDYQWRKAGPDGLFVDNKWNVPQPFLSTRMQILLHARSIPAMGYETFRVIPKADPDRCSGSLMPSANTLENEFLRVEVAGNGTLAVVDKERKAEYWGLGYLQDQGEAGNAWRHAAPKQDRVINSLGAPARVSVIENGPLAATLKIDLSIRVPSEGIGELDRSASEVGLPVTHWIRLAKGSRRVEVTTEFDNRAKDHWLRLMFPTGLETGVSNADSHFDVVTSIALPDAMDGRKRRSGPTPSGLLWTSGMARRAWRFSPKGCMSSKCSTTRSGRWRSRSCVRYASNSRSRRIASRNWRTRVRSVRDRSASAGRFILTRECGTRAIASGRLSNS